ncbi:thioredoxin domain-containing protein [Candidatus Woesearchaeota archaeon]|nr:thioredoxin domain-containing protein [Candidatus Woesearchaeota archaeon]
MIVKWNDWNLESFEKSKKESKPILLAISAVWCHWCHTMDRNTYNNKEIGKFINANFIPIRVDTDKRPDINDRYNLGGWPTTAVLNNEGELLTGATYIPPEHMAQFLEQGLKFFKENKKISHAVQELEPGLISSIKNYMISVIKEYYDSINGGFGDEPKFPHFELLFFILYVLKQEQNEELKKILIHALDAMLKSELHDQVEGGFYRYATLQNWTIPHFEKMLEDNAQFLSVYCEAYLITKKEEYKKTAEDILTFLFSLLYDEKTGLFKGSQDADEEYCNLSIAERKKRKKPFIDPAHYTGWNAITIQSLLTASVVFEKKSYVQIAEKAMKNLLKTALSEKGILRLSDGIVYLSDQTNILSALLMLYQYTFDKMYLEHAKKIAKLFENLYDAEKGGWFDILDSNLGELRVKKKLFQENALLALALLQYDALTEEDHKEQIEKALSFFANYVRVSGPFAAHYARAVEVYQNGLYHFTIEGRKKEIKQIHEILLKKIGPRAVISFCSKNKTLIVLVCKGTVCLKGITKKEELIAFFKQ